MKSRSVKKDILDEAVKFESWAEPYKNLNNFDAIDYFVAIAIIIWCIRVNL